MKGLSKWIISVIDEVNNEIRQDLGIEIVEPQKSPDVEFEEESDEAKAFGKILNEIEASYIDKRIRSKEEPEIDKNSSSDFIRIVNFKCIKN